jgi:hypothetical protein
VSFVGLSYVYDLSSVQGKIFACKREHRRRYLDLKGRKMGHGEDCIMMIFIAFILHLILLGQLNQEE